MFELFTFLQTFVDNLFLDLHKFLTALLLHQFGASWFICDILFMFGELFETIATYFFFLFFLALSIYYRNSLFVIYEKHFFKASLTFNVIALFLRNNVFFTNLLSSITFFFEQIKNFFRKK